MRAFDTVEVFLGLLFGAIIVGIIFTNPAGVKGLWEGLADFSGKTVEAFSGKGGFVGRAI